MFPPLHLVDFVEMEFKDFGAGWRGSERPCGFVDVDFVWEVTLIYLISFLVFGCGILESTNANDRFLAFDA
jgi:hypothetical protein